MKAIITKLYSFKELNEKAQKRVLEDEATAIKSEPWDNTLDECMASLKAIAKALNIRLMGWEIGAYNQHNFCKIEDTEFESSLNYFTEAMQKAGYRMVSDAPQFEGKCPFTGVCFDEDIAEEIYKCLVAGESMQEAFNSAASRIGRICEDDLEYRSSKEGILEYLDQSEEVYTENGHKF